MTQMASKGIDYGLGRTNIDLKTNIRFGVIPAHAVGQAWYEDSEAVYPPPCCPECLGEIDDPDTIEQCPHCEKVIEVPDVCYPEEPLEFKLADGEYQATQSGGDSDIFILESPFFTYAQFCSPCAPGACYLLNPTQPDYNNVAYCFGHDWFEDGKAPYPVWSIETGKLVEAVQ